MWLIHLPQNRAKLKRRSGFINLIDSALDLSETGGKSFQVLTLCLQNDTNLPDVNVQTIELYGSDDRI